MQKPDGDRGNAKPGQKTRIVADIHVAVPKFSQADGIEGAASPPRARKTNPEWSSPPKQFRFQQCCRWPIRDYLGLGKRRGVESSTSR
jgi:hypothetical protein